MTMTNKTKIAIAIIVMFMGYWIYKVSDYWISRYALYHHTLGYQEGMCSSASQIVGYEVPCEGKPEWDGDSYQIPIVIVM